MFSVLLRGSRLLLLAAVATLAAAHVVCTMFWSRFDQVDDSGYMLAILRGIAGGGRLYDDVFSQYGPFYGLAWLPWFRLMGAPIDHNHAALGVVIIWILSVAITGWLVQRHTKSVYWTAAALIWGTWSLTKLGSEIAHPKSLVALLCALLLAGLALICHRHRRLGAVVAGAVLAALLLTKINTGVFAMIAVFLGGIAGLKPLRRLAVPAALASAAVPFLLLQHAWDPGARILLGFSTWISSFMALQITASRKNEALAPAAVIGWSDAWLLATSFAVCGSIILLMSLAWGTSAHALLDGVLLRPLAFSSVSQNPPKVTWLETLTVLASAALALAWQFPYLRRIKALWRGAMIMAVAAELTWDACRGWSYLFTAPALLWLAVAASHSNEESHDQADSMLWLTFLVQLAAWQSLSIFPINGAQSSLPKFLSSIVFLIGLREALVGMRAHRPTMSRKLVHTATLAFLAGLAVISWNAYQFGRSNVLRHIPFRGAGAEWFNWRPEQTARMNSVAENLKQQPGPVFTFHGQPSLAIWSGKPVVKDGNRLHFVHFVTDRELAEIFKSFADEPAWSAVKYDDGLSFGSGKYVDATRTWLQAQTVHWLRIGEYELRLKAGSPAKPPVCAAWKSDAGWRVTLLAKDATAPKKGRLNDGSSNLASFKWEGYQWQPVAAAPGYVESPAPPELSEALDKHDNPNIIIIAYSSKWKALFAFPVVQLISRP